MYRGKKRVSLEGYGDSSAAVITLFPCEGLGIVVLCTKPSLLNLAISNLISDFMLGVQPSPAPWCSWFEDLPFPFTLSSYQDALKKTPPIISAPKAGSLQPQIVPSSRPMSSYVGYYSSALLPLLIFQVLNVVLDESSGRQGLILKIINGYDSKDNEIGVYSLACIQFGKLIIKFRHLMPKLILFDIRCIYDTSVAI